MSPLPHKIQINFDQDREPGHDTKLQNIKNVLSTIDGNFSLNINGDLVFSVILALYDVLTCIYHFVVLC